MARKKPEPAPGLDESANCCEANPVTRTVELTKRTDISLIVSETNVTSPVVGLMELVDFTSAVRDRFGSQAKVFTSSGYGVTRLTAVHERDIA